MSKILVPVDFSYASKNAYVYALQLADQLGLNVDLVHFYGGSITPGKPLIITGDGSIQGSVHRRLQEFSKPNPLAPAYDWFDVPEAVTISYTTGISLTPSAAINKMAASQEYDLVVMATHSYSGPIAKWLGSTAATVSESCLKPVILIPPKVDYTPYDRIVVANNFETAHPLVLDQLTAWAEAFGASMHFVHIVTPTEAKSINFVPWRLMEKLIDGKPSPKFAYEISNVEDANIASGLEDFAEEREADLLVVVNRRRSRWGALVHRSLTQDLALTTKRPLLVLHTEENAWVDY